MDRDTLSALYDRQIEALLADDRAALEAALGIEFEDPFEGEEETLHHQAWNETGDISFSLFASLPGSCGCLVEAKEWANGGSLWKEFYPERVNSARHWADVLGLQDNPLIPGRLPTYDVRFTREQLEEFKRLQLLARFGE